MPTRVLVTGAAGFFGSFMCEYISNLVESIEVIGTDIVKPDKTSWAKFIRADLSCSEDVENLVHQTMPECVIHLAGTFGTENGLDLFKTNTLALIILLEAICRFVPGAIIIAAGSAAEYGRIKPKQLPVDEKTSCHPITHYGMSKMLATQIVLYYHDVYNVNTMVIRPFQLIGRGITARLAPGAFTQQIRKAIADGSNVIRVGNVDSFRDFLDVHDAVEAVWALCQKPANGHIFNLCSGVPIKIIDLLRTIIRLSGANVEVEADVDRLPNEKDVPILFGSYLKIKNHCGWEPKRSLCQSVQEMLS
jgi:GDP-4-dehydro-6-deoxy-D-mannose reductase